MPEGGFTVVDWTSRLGADPLPWLLEEETPAVRATALRYLLDRPESDPDYLAARAAAMSSGPIAAILAAQHPEGYWVKPGPGYAPKYAGTVWQLIFLDQMGADPADWRVRAACEYVLAHCPTSNGGLGCSGSHLLTPPPPSAVIHCLSGNLLRALIGFGWLTDPRVQRAVEWQARSVTGDGFDRYYASGTSGPGFCCAANDKRPCAWGAIKAVLGLAAIPEAKRGPEVGEALRLGGEFLLGRDPAVADYPFPSYASKPNGSWFKLGFPSAYVTDVLQNLEALCALGYGRDARLRNALDWLLTKQVAPGRWANTYAYNGKTTVDIEKQGQMSKWVTLRACTVLRAATSFCIH
jgi:hypothetical protein